MLQTIDEPTKRTASIRAAHGEAMALLERYGIDSLLDRYSNGETLTDIARALYVNVKTLTAFVNRFAQASEYAHAKECHAEAWADRGWNTLQAGENEVLDSASVNLKRYKEQHCRWRAGIANSRYSEKQSVELSGPNGGPIQAQSVVTVYIPANTRDVVHEVDGETLDKDDV
jgi:hypothetical protein